MLNEIIKLNYYFSSEIQEKKAMSKKLSKYIAAFDYIDKTLIVLIDLSCFTRLEFLQELQKQLLL